MSTSNINLNDNVITTHGCLANLNISYVYDIDNTDNIKDIIKKELKILLLDEPEFLQELMNELRIQKINKLKK